MMDTINVRNALLERAARLVTEKGGERRILAVDGVDGAGKTVFADELAEAVVALGWHVIRASVDGFHNPRALRYRRGRSSPEGFFLDSYDYDALRTCLLAPFRHGEACVRTACFDHRADSEVVRMAIEVPRHAILLIDGIFLHRDGLHEWWDSSIFLEVPFEVTYARMATRDGSDPNPDAPANRRYLEGQRMYLRQCDPLSRATIVVDNSDLSAPRLARPGLSGVTVC